MDYFKLLPEEITVDIFTRLPTDSVVDSKLVCRNWNNLVSHHPSFRRMHFSHHLNHSFGDGSGKLSGFIALSSYKPAPKFYYFENHDQSTITPIQRIRRLNFTSPIGNDVRFVGSCNGLLCLFGGYFARPSYFVCNPITKEYVVLPEIKRNFDDLPENKRKCDIARYVKCMSGFGYISSTNEYKVVDILTTGYVQVHIYTIGSDKEWRNLGNFDSNITSFPYEQPVFADGTLYWMNVKLGIIITLNLAEEKFCEHISLPPLPPQSDCYENRITVLDGHLFLAMYLVVGGDKFYDIWVFKKKSNAHDTKERVEHQSFVWSKEFRIDRSECFAITKTNGVLTYTGNYLNTYDTKNSTSTRLVDFKERIWQVLPHKNTLVSLTELGQEDVKIMESLEVEKTENHYQPLKQL